MKLEIITLVDVFCVIIAYLTSVQKYDETDASGKVVTYLLLFSSITELTAECVYIFSRNKAPLFHFSAIVNFLIVTIYFIKIIKPRKELVFMIMAFTILPGLSVLNSVYLQPLNKPNTNVFVLRSFCITAMALLALYKILVDEQIKKVTRYPHFYFWTFLLLMHAGTFFFWGLLLLIARQNKQYLILIQFIQATINAIIYLGLGSTFLLYKKKAAYE